MIEGIKEKGENPTLTNLTCRSDFVTKFTPITTKGQFIETEIVSVSGRVNSIRIGGGGLVFFFATNKCHKGTRTFEEAHENVHRSGINSNNYDNRYQ